MSWRGFDEIKRIEVELQRKIYDILHNLVFNKKFKFHGIAFSDVRFSWSIDRREADLVILGPNPNDVFLIIETKRKEAPSKVIGHVTDRAYIGQALSYAALAKRKGLNPYFIAVCNPDAIAVYKVPDDVEKILKTPILKIHALLLPSDFYEALGYEHPFGEFYGLIDYIPTKYTKEEILDAIQKVPDEVTKLACVSGTPEDIIQIFDEYEKIGVEHIVIWNLTYFGDVTKIKSSYALIDEVISHF